MSSPLTEPGESEDSSAGMGTKQEIPYPLLRGGLSAAAKESIPSTSISSTV